MEAFNKLARLFARLVACREPAATATSKSTQSDNPASRLDQKMRTGLRALGIATALIFFGQAAAAVTFVGTPTASPTTFSGAGQTIDLSVTFNTDSYAYNSASITFQAFPAGSVQTICPPGTNQTNATVTCTARYVTTSSDTSNLEIIPIVTVNGLDTATYNGGIITVAYTGSGPAAPVAGAVSKTVAYGSSANSIPLDFSGGGTPTSVAVTSQPSHGTTSVSGTSITYTPTAGYAGADSFSYTGTNSTGTSNAATASITVSNPTLSIAASGSFSATVGQSYSQTFTFSGGTAPYIGYSILGIPAGLSVTAFNSTSITISGTPTVSGTFQLTVAGTDSSTGNGPFKVTKSFTLTIASATISITSPASLTNATVGSPYSQVIKAGGGIAPYTFTVQSGSLPAGVNLTTSGTLKGTPTAGGTFSFTVKATDSSTGTGSPANATKTYTLTVNQPTISVAPTTLPDAAQNTAYSQTITASGGTSPYTYSVSGTLPTGMTLSSGGVLSGTPTGYGSFNFSITATDSSTGTGPYTGTQNYAFNVTAASPVISTTSLPGAMVGTPYNQTITATSGNAPYTFSIASGTLPANISLSSGGVLSGTPTTAGSYDFTVQVKDGAGNTDQQSYAGFTVSKAATGVSLTLSSSSALQGVPVTMTASVTSGASPTGNIIFRDGGTAIATVALSGSTASYTTRTLSTGSHSITADYSGDAANAPASSAAQSLAVNGRPAPELDPTVRSMIVSQVSTSHRFGQTQIDNTHRRLDTLHGMLRSGGSRTGWGTTSQAFAGTGGAPEASAAQGATTPSTNYLLDPAATNSESSSEPEQVIDLVSRALQPAQNGSDLPYRIWATGTLDFGRDQVDGGYTNKLSTQGITLGVDRVFGSDIAAGAALGFGYNRTTFGPDGSKSRSRAKTVSLYATWQMKPDLFLDATGGYGKLNFRENRYSTDGGVMLSGERGGHMLFGSLGLSQLGQLGRWSTSSYGRLDVVKLSLDSYSETGSSVWALDYGKLENTTASSVIGITAEYDMRRDWGTLTPGAQLEYRHAFNGGFTQTLGYADLGTMDYSFAGDTQSQDALTLGLSLRGTVDQNMDFELGYQFTSDLASAHSQQVRASMHISF
ncbi:hypothetical protein BMI85_04840 [Thioclava sp. DLFJ4-1]|nr:hypothetical protein BMI85_04840 [Thioclava sp. DLFJ4-1]